LPGQVGDLEPELVIDGCLLGGPGAADDVAQVAEGGDEGADVVFGEPAAGLVAGLGGVARECGGALGLDLAGPLGDGLGVASGVESGLVAGEPAGPDGTQAVIAGVTDALAADGASVRDMELDLAGQHVLTPYRGRNKPASQKAANSAHAKLRAPGERANAQLKTWAILRKLRCCPWRAGQIAKAIYVLQAAISRDEKRSLSPGQLKELLPSVRPRKYCSNGRPGGIRRRTQRGVRSRFS
jgi:hypothetical protein